MNISTSFLVISLLLQLLLVKSNVFKVPKVDDSLHVPALYVFGDSLVDNGNNNYLGSSMRADKFPYGVDFNCTTGRFTNGRNEADFIAEIARLPYPPPYLSLSYSKNLTTKTGVNYASGGCGILRSTGKDQVMDFKNGICLDFEIQIQLFKATLENLRPQFKGSKKFASYLSKSLFFVNIGSSDLGMDFNFNRKFPSRRFGIINRRGGILLRILSIRLKALYELGARKFLVNTIGIIGCVPEIRLMIQNTQMLRFRKVKPETPCAEGLNMLVRRYNRLLRVTLERLQSQLPGSLFVHGDVYKLFEDIKSAPASYGISETNNACYDDIYYKKDAKCSEFKNIDFNKCLFFDKVHPTQAVHFYMTKRCFEDKTICSPITLKELMKAN